MIESGMRIFEPEIPAGFGQVYGLRVGDGPWRYVGLTKRGIAKRYPRSSLGRGLNRPVDDWLRKHWDDVVAQSLEVAPVQDLPELEIRWIAKLGTMRQLGTGGLNLTVGGDRGLEGYRHDAVARSKMVESSARRWSRPGAREEASAARARMLADPEIDRLLRESSVFGTHRQSHEARGVVSPTCVHCVGDSAVADRKFCPRCELLKDFEDFAVAKARRDGRASWCKACMAEHKRSKKGQEGA